ncbi:hypothetical protein ACXYL9_03190 [Qipengyuania sp. CAU 1752]
MFETVNDALNQAFLDGRFESRPLYLVLDNAGRRRVADILDVDEDEVEAHCCEVVGQALEQSGDPYSKIDLRRRRWSRSGRDGLPPFTALLFVLSHAAELMVSDGDFRASNYYQRLAGLVGLPVQRLSQHGKSTVPFWRSFSRWLADTDFRYGRPTARAVNANKYVGVAMSQAIVREEDRQRLHDMFEKYGFSGTDEITEAEVEQYVSTWVTTSRPTNAFKGAWKKTELRGRICEVVIAELEEWKEERVEDGKASSSGASRLSLVMAYNHDLLSRSANFWLGKEASGEPVELEGPGGKPFQLANTRFGGVKTLEPRSSLAFSSTLLQGIELAAPGGSKFSWAGRAAIPLSRSEQGSYWTEVNRVSFGVENVVLVRDEPKLRGAIEDALEQVAIPGYTLATPANLKGVPRGWVLYEGVRVFKALDEIKGFEAVLSPVARSAGLKLERGTRLARGIWHASRPPLVTFDGEAPPTRITVFEGTNNEGDVLADKSECGRQVTLDLADYLPESGNVFIEGHDDGKTQGTASLLFRSANRPRPLDRSGRGLLAYTGALGASPLDPSADDAVVGMVAPPAELVDASLDILASFEDLGRLLGEDWQEEAEPPVHEEEHQGDELVDRRGMTPEELEPLPCAVRGFHWLKYAQVLPSASKYAPVDVTCSHCNVAYLHRRKVKKKQVKSRATAKRAVPRSQPTAPRSEERLDDMGLWLDALSFLGTGSVASFEEITSASAIDAWRAGPLLRNLSWLGHVDLELNPAFRPRAWSIPPATLSFISETEAVLTGFRSQSLVAALRGGAVDAGGDLEIRSMPAQPPIVTLRGFTPVDTEIVLAGIKDGHGRSIRITEDAASRIASYVDAAGSLFDVFIPATLGVGAEIQRFDLDHGHWRTVEETRVPGAYRVTRAGNAYVFKDQSGNAFSAPQELAKLAAARALGVRLHTYDAEKREFTCLLGCEPPGLLGRALVACSGELPRVQSRTSTFARVPPSIAARVLAILYQGDLPS